MTTGQRIAQKRKEQGLSQEALGERLGVTRQSVYKVVQDPYGRESVYSDFPYVLEDGTLTYANGAVMDCDPLNWQY